MLPGKTGHLPACFSETISRCELPPTVYADYAASSRPNHGRRAHDALTISRARQRCGNSQDPGRPQGALGKVTHSRGPRDHGARSFFNEFLGVFKVHFLSFD